MNLSAAAAVALFLVLAIAYALVCRWVAEYADRKGHSYWGFALLSLAISPLWGYVIAVLAPDESDGHVPRAQRGHAAPN